MYPASTSAEKRQNVMDVDDSTGRKPLASEFCPTDVDTQLASQQRWLPGERQALGCIHLALIGAVVSLALLGVLFGEVSWPSFFAVEAVCIAVLMGAIDVLRRRRAGVVLLICVHGCLMVVGAVMLWNAAQRLSEPLPAPHFLKNIQWFEEQRRNVALCFSLFVLVVAGLMQLWLASILRRPFSHAPSRESGCDTCSNSEEGASANTTPQNGKSPLA